LYPRGGILAFFLAFVKRTVGFAIQPLTIPGERLKMDPRNPRPDDWQFIGGIKYMLHIQKKVRVPAILALVIILVGCSGPTVVAPPTPDIPAVRTEAVQTVVAKLTIEAALNPSPTAEAPQAPQVITATQAPTETAQPEPTATTAATSTSAPAGGTTGGTTSGGSTTGGSTSGGSVVYPTATRRTGPDQAQFVSQDPTDGRVYNAGNEFDGTWTFKNIGTSTWTTGYEYRFAGGTNLAKERIYTLPKRVAPGDSVTLITDMVAPASIGRYVSNWELVNENGDVFAVFYMVIDVK
jgi:hypothetical protein